MSRTLWGVADPEQLAALGKLLEEFSKEMRISGDEEARERLADRILALFNEGVAPEDIRRRLDSSPGSPLDSPATHGAMAPPPEEMS